MKMSDEQSDEFLKWINDKWQDEKECPVCHTSDWAVNSHIFEMREFDMGKLSTGGTVYPVVPMLCKNCAFVVTFNAVKIGLVGTEQNNSDEKEESNG